LFLLAGAGVNAASLPTFQDFRRIDRVRRMTGQMQSEELMAVMHVAPSLIQQTAAANTNDATMLWGAAELMQDWPKQKELFEQAMSVGGTNAEISLRFACAAARQGDLSLADKWFKRCETNDTENLAPWLGELWVMKKRRTPLKEPFTPSVLAMKFHDYSVAASRARIQVLEAAGYSKYSARRLGFSPDSMLLTMARDLSHPPYEDNARPFLKQLAAAMQKFPAFLLTELVGQTLEGALLASRPDATTDPEVRTRTVELSERREDLKDLLAKVQQNAVDFATEGEMVEYFELVLSDGEENAMKWLLTAVQHQPTEKP
jgi:hypothetical protein